MAKKDQHYVPRAYLKKWEAAAYSPDLKQRANPIYVFDKMCHFVGERSTNTICTNSHTYTIDWEHSFISEKCTEIKKDFGCLIYTVLSNRGVTAFYNGKELSSADELAGEMKTFDNWDFYYQNGNLAPKKRIQNEVGSLHSYVIEDKFDIAIENDLEDTINGFVDEVQRATLNATNEFRVVREESAKTIFEILMLMACRNPSFDCFGLYSSVIDLLFGSIDADDDNGLFWNRAAEVMKRGVWLTEIYKILYREKTNIFDTVWTQFKKQCQFILFRVKNVLDYGFITSDNPAFFYTNNIEQENHNGVYFPLSPEYLLMAAKCSNGSIDEIDYRLADRKDARMLNRIIQSAAEKVIISKQKNIDYIL